MLVAAGKNKKASVLILLLIVVSAMTTIVVGSVYRTKIAMRLVHSNSQKIKAYYLAIGGLERTKALLVKEDLTPQWAAKVSNFQSNASSEGLFNEQTTSQQDIQMSLSYLIKDELANFNLNSSDPACWEKINGITSEIRSCIEDWIDKDSDTNLSGAEDDYYQRLTCSYGCKNLPIKQLRELAYIKNIGLDKYYDQSLIEGKIATETENDNNPPASLVEIFTVYGDGKLNINTVSKKILSTLPGLDTQTVNTIINYRNTADSTPSTDDDNYIDSAESLAKIEGLTELEIELLEQYCCFTSKFFRIYCTADIQKNKCTLMSTIEITENGPQILSTERLL